MSLKFRLKGLAETFIDKIVCPACHHDGGEEGDNDFYTELSRVTFDGIVAVIRCGVCNHIFVPSEQRLGVINPQRLRDAVEKDSLKTGQPIYQNKHAVVLDVERLNAAKRDKIQ